MKRPWRRPRLRTLLLLLLIGVVAWSGYTYWSDYSQRSARQAREWMAPTEGAACRAVFRGDALGLKSSGVRPTTVDGNRNYVAGQFVRMNDQWLVLDETQPSRRIVRVWIPRDQLLLLEEDQ